MKKPPRQFDVVPVAVVLQNARILEENNAAVEGFQRRCTPANASQEPSPDKDSKEGEQR